MKPIKKPERLTKHLDFRLTKTELDILKGLARKHKVSMNLVLRHLIQQEHESKNK